MISEFMAALKTDDEVRNFITNASSPDEVAVIEYATSVCHHCYQVFPEFYALSKEVILNTCSPKNVFQFPGLRYAVAHIEHLSTEGTVKTERPVL